jgi:hypothetical protein
MNRPCASDTLVESKARTEQVRWSCVFSAWGRRRAGRSAGSQWTTGDRGRNARRAPIRNTFAPRPDRRRRAPNPRRDRCALASALQERCRPAASSRGRRRRARLPSNCRENDDWRMFEPFRGAAGTFWCWTRCAHRA